MQNMFCYLSLDILKVKFYSLAYFIQPNKYTVQRVFTILFQNDKYSFLKQCSSRSNDFNRSQLIRIHTVFPPDDESIIILKLHDRFDGKFKVRVV